MATQPIKFHSLNQTQYAGATKTDGGLYFINDNGEIRKGDKHVTGTRVYTATGSRGQGVDDLTIKIDGQDISTADPQLRVDFTYDPQEGTGWSGTVYLDETSSDSGIWEYVDGDGEDAITYRVSKPQGNESWKFEIEKNETILEEATSDGDDPTSKTMEYSNYETPPTLSGTSKMSTPEQPKKGDVLIVTTPLSDGKNETSAYIYATNGGAYNVSGWQACDGNVDASKVILTQDYTLAGNYTSVGNLNKGTEYASTGKSVAQVLQEIFTKELQPGTPSNPSFTLSGSNGEGEVGSTYPAQTYTGTWKDGSYTYGAWVSNGTTQTATGTTVGDWTISAYDGKTQANATISGNTASITTTAYQITGTSAFTLATFNVTNNTNGTLPAATNLKTKSNPEKKITTTSNTAQSRTVTGFRYWFYGSSVSGKTKEAAKADYWTTEDGSSDATVQTNTNIRSLNKSKSTTTINVVANADVVVLAIPANKTLTAVTSENQFGSEITGNFTASMHTVNVGGGDSTAQSIGNYATSYKVYIYYIDSPENKSDVYTITVS